MRILTPTLSQMPKRLIVVLCGLVAYTPSFGEAPAPTETIESLALFNTYAHFSIPTLDPKQHSQLAKGRVVKLRQLAVESAGPQRVIGLVRIDQPRELLWLALRDIHWSAAKEITEIRLSEPRDWPRIWYQHLAAPWPIADRHYVLNVWDNWDLEAASDGTCWEHWWELHPEGERLASEALAAGRIPGLDTESTEGAVYVPINDGAWLICELQSGASLLGYHVRFVAGGRIPDRLIADYGMATLGRVLRDVEKRAANVPAHYRGGHYLIPGGDGQDLPLYTQ